MGNGGYEKDGSCSLITVSDLAIKSATKRVSLNVHHRLCAWHLMRNATSDIKVTVVLLKLKRSIGVSIWTDK